MWGRRKKEDLEHIVPNFSESNTMGYMFEKTKLYTLSNDQIISVPQNMTANIYFDYADPLTVTTCQKKNLIKIAKIRSDKYGKQFYVLFTRNITPDAKNWGIGKIPLECDGIEFQIGANGKFRFSITDPKKYISTVGKGVSKVYTETDVVEDVKNVVGNAATEIVKELFKEVDTIVTNCSFLCDEYAQRLSDYFIRDAHLDEQGINLEHIDIDHMGIRAEDKLEAQKALVKRMRQEREAAKRAAENKDTEISAVAEQTGAAPSAATSPEVSPKTAEVKRSAGETKTSDTARPAAMATDVSVGTGNVSASVKTERAKVPIKPRTATTVKRTAVKSQRETDKTPAVVQSPKSGETVPVTENAGNGEEQS